MSAAVRADFHENNLSSQQWKQSNNKVCQDGTTSKVISVILGCASKTHSDLEIRSSCLEDVDFPKGKLMTRTLFLLAHFIVVTLVIPMHGFQNSLREGNYIPNFSAKIRKSIRIYSGFEIRSSCLEDVDFPKDKLMT